MNTSMSTMLPAEFYQKDTLSLARHLLGKVLVRPLDGDLVTLRIVEVEAYHQDGDEAAHSFRGKTPRNKVMFGPPGFLYVYFIYGMHFCMNVVSEVEGTGAAVLIRALEPLDGLGTLRARRGKTMKDTQLTNGPARCCQALGINRDQDGLSLLSDQLWLCDAPFIPDEQLVTTTRIGIRKSADLPWRFYIKDNLYVSKRATDSSVKSRPTPKPSNM